MKSLMAAGIAFVLTACGQSHPDSVALETLMVHTSTGEEDTCRRCTVRLDSVVVITQPPGATGGPIISSSLTVGPDHHYYLAPTAEPGTAEVYDSDGERIHILGREGDGPGELRAVIGAARLSDSLIVVVDRAKTNPFVLFDTSGVHTGSLEENAVRSIRGVRWTQHGVLILFTRHEHDRVTTGALIHGDSIAPIASVPVENTQDIHIWGDVEVAVTEAGYWIAKADRFDLRMVDKAGNQLKHFARTPRHFETDTPARVIGITPLDTLLAVVTIIRNADVEEPKNWESTRAYTPEIVNKLWLTRIDIVDPGDGRYVSSAYVNRSIQGVAGPGLVYSFSDEDDGSMGVRVWRIKLSQHGGSE